MHLIVRLMVFLYKGTIESSLPGDSPTIMFSISTAACKISSSTMGRVFLYFATLYPILLDAIKALPGIDVCLKNVRSSSFSSFNFLVN